jgi:hypothetical protein
MATGIGSSAVSPTAASPSMSWARPVGSSVMRFGDQLAVLFDDGDVVVGFGPVDAAEEFHSVLSSGLVKVSV